MDLLDVEPVVRLGDRLDAGRLDDRGDPLQLYDSAGAPALAAATTTAPSSATMQATAPQGPVEKVHPTESDVAG